jgi:zinc protease
MLDAKCRVWRRVATTLGVAILLSLAIGLGAAPARAQRAELQKSIQRRILDNGLEVIVVENHGVPLANVEIDVKNGSFTQTPAYVGLAHMYEHMFFRANQQYPEPGDFVDRASELGAVFNGTTTEERVNYYLTLPADSLAGGMRFLAAALRHPLFLPNELAREKEVVLGEYDRQEASPFFVLDQTMGQKLWPNNWNRKNVIGDRTVVKNVTPDQMREIQRRYYIPNNSSLLVTGDVDPDEVFSLARTIYGDWPRGADPFATDPIPPMTPLSGNQAVIAEGPVSAVTIEIQWQGPSVRADPASTYAADVFSDALNQPGSGFQRRLVDSGLFQGVLVNYYTLDHVGPITISGQTTADKFPRALAALEHEIGHFADPGYITAEELAEVKAQRAVSTAFTTERTSGYTHIIGFWWAVASLDYFMGYVDNMATRTTSDLGAYARRYIVGKPYVIGVLASPEDRQALHLTEQSLLQPGPTP